MIERFNLWEYNDSAKGGVIEATKSDYHGFADGTLTNIGYVKLDVSEVKFSGNGLPIFPLKPMGSLEKSVKNRGGRSKAKVYIVDVNGFNFGFMTAENESLEGSEHGLILNGRGRIPFLADERRLLDKFGVIGIDDEVNIGYSGLRGEIDCHNSTIRSKNPKEYCFADITLRDYFSF